MKRILFVSDNLCSGGAQRQMVTIAGLLKHAGFDVIVYCYDKDDFNAHVLTEAGIPIVWEFEPNCYLRRIRNVRRFIRTGGFNSVISFLPTCNFLNNVAAIGKHDWKVITGERSSRESTFTSYRGKLFGWFQRYSDYIVCNSENACRMWTKYRPSLSSRMKVIYNCVQLGSIRSDYIIKKSGRLHIVVAATYQYLKNPLGLVGALSLMNIEERNYFAIDWYGRIEVERGNTMAYDDTVKAIKDNGLEDILRLHPDTKDINDIMYQADVVMLLSQFEGLPNAVCEGMALGKPIIMTRVSDYSVLVDESNGLLCDADDISSIRSALVKMLSFDTVQLQRMGRASKTKAELLFSKESVTQSWIGLI